MKTLLFFPLLSFIQYLVIHWVLVEDGADGGFSKKNANPPPQKEYVILTGRRRKKEQTYKRASALLHAL